MRKLVLYILVFMALLGTTHADQGGSSVPTYIRNQVPQAVLTGHGRAHYFIWQLYDAALYAPGGEYDPQKPFALSLRYLRAIKGRDIADTSAREMRRLGIASEIKIAAWHEQMRRVFPDVTPGMVLTGVHLKNGHVILFMNGKKIGQFEDSDFGQSFFAIWLDPKTRLPNLRKSLLGGGI